MALTSCSNNKGNLVYFNNLKANEGVVTQGNYEIRIVPDDELAISISSAAPEATAAYNLPLTNLATRSSLPVATQAQQLTYLVDSEGYIKMPLIGKVKAAGLTTSQLENTLTDIISRDVNDPIVKVTIVNFTVDVIGEVKHPTSIKVDRQRFSILDALAQAQDLSDYGIRTTVLLIREENGQKSYHRLNLQDASILESPYYYLKQNDVIYVEPNDVKHDNSKYNTNNAFKISVISTIASACSVVASLVIALAIK